MLRPQRSILNRYRRRNQLAELTELTRAILDPYRIEHLELTAKYALDLADHFPQLGQAERFELTYAAMAHDLLKVKAYDPKSSKIHVATHELELDLNRYVRLNLDYLKPFGLDVYFNTDVQLHALASGMFVNLELKIDDPRILYPIFFHSCPILPVYERLDDRTKLMVDIIVLADKLSSGQLKPGRVTIDLHRAIFGAGGCEFNFTAGVYLARLISQGESTEKYSRLMTEYYHRRWVDQNPVVAKISRPVKPLKKLKRKKKEVTGSDVQETRDHPGDSDVAVARDHRSR